MRRSANGADDEAEGGHRRRWLHREFRELVASVKHVGPAALHSMQQLHEQRQTSATREEALNETTATCMKLQVEVLWKLNDKLDSHETRLAQHQTHAAEFDERLKCVKTLVELRHVPVPLPPHEERAPHKVRVHGARDREPNGCSKLSAEARELLRRVALERLPPRVLRRDRCASAKHSSRPAPSAYRTCALCPLVLPEPRLPRVLYRAATPIVLSLSLSSGFFYRFIAH